MDDSFSIISGGVGIKAGLGGASVALTEALRSALEGRGSFACKGVESGIRSIRNTVRCSGEFSGRREDGCLSIEIVMLGNRKRAKMARTHN